MNKDILKEYGIDSQEGLKRCMNDEAFYARYLGMLLEDDSLARACVACEKHDHKALFQCLHEMKGMSSNAALIELYQSVCPLVELLRFDSGTDEEIDKLFVKVKDSYNRTCEGVRLALDK